MERDYKEEVKLNKDILDDCAIEQAELYGFWSEQWARAVLERDKAKQQLDVAKAGQDKLVRENPEHYGWATGKAPTEKFIESAVLLSQNCNDAVNKLIEAQFNVNIMVAAKEAFQDRSNQLDVLARLYSSNYFTTKIPSTTKQRLIEKNKREVQDKLDANKRVRKIIKKEEEVE